jgi:hypothetical protein
MSSKSLDLLQKNVNALVVSQTRSIDKFWSNCRSEYGIRSKTPKNFFNFEIVWSKISKKSTKINAKLLYGGVQKKPRGIRDKEVFEPLPEYE